MLMHLDWWTRTALLLVGVLTSAQGWTQEVFGDSADDVVQAAQDLQDDVSKLRHLPFVDPVNVSVLDEVELRRQILREYDEDFPHEEALRVSVSLRLFGLIPDDLDLYQLMLDVLTEQIGGYYDPEEKGLYLIRRTEVTDPSSPMAQVNMERMVTLHELVHALQDQHFDLHAMIARDFQSDDVQLAIQALIEGDASYVMFYDQFADLGMDLDQANLTALLAVMGNMDMPGMGEITQNAPLYLKETLLFPYMHGAGFAQQIKVDFDWSRVNQSFSQPPLSSEQILHPEKYLTEPDWPQHLTLPDMSRSLGRKWSKIDENTTGEFGIRVWLKHHAMGEAYWDAAAGWDGDRYQAYHREGEPPVLVWFTTWDSEEEAIEFRDMVSPWVQSREQESGDEARTSRVVHRASDVLLLLDAPTKRTSKLTERLWVQVERTELTDLDVIAPPKAGVTSSP